ncbi:MAG: hypothetical protein IAE91_01495 [Ignavibacteriaceae bacterium]|nr:hypothetical protein [Ignavibacteriaceae bacterium]
MTKLRFLQIALALFLILSFIPTFKLHAASHSKKVFAVGINPVENGQSVVSKFWGNATQIENTIFNIARNGFSQIGIDYTIADRMTVSEFPTLPSGQPVFNMASYTKCISGGTPQDIQNCDNSKWQFDYSKFFDDFGICTAANNANADEIWLVTPPYIGKFESFMIGPYQGFWINGEAVVNSSCNKLYPVMGPTYDRQDTLLHNFGHRIESTIEYIFSNISDSDRNSHWRRFSGFGGQPLGCGNTHFPANYRFDYDYGNTAFGTFSCPDWKNFPNYTGATISVGCNSWGCNDPGWETFWFSYIPSSGGDAQIYNSGGLPLNIKKDWWYYILNPSEAINFVNYTYNPGVISCNYNYTSWGICSGGTQSRSVTETYPQGCSGGTPLLTQNCTVCYKYEYTPWGNCSNGVQKRFISKQTEVLCPGEGIASLERNCSTNNVNTGNTNNPEASQNENPQQPEQSESVETNEINEPVNVLPPVSFTVEDVLYALFGIPIQKSDSTEVSYPVSYSNQLNQSLIRIMVILAALGGIVISIIIFLYKFEGLKRFKR